MTCECHVRFYQGLEVKLLRSTHQLANHVVMGPGALLDRIAAIDRDTVRHC
jgi:hypothetical protein